MPAALLLQKGGHEVQPAIFARVKNDLKTRFSSAIALARKHGSHASTSAFAAGTLQLLCFANWVGRARTDKRMRWDMAGISEKAADSSYGHAYKHFPISHPTSVSVSAGLNLDSS